MHFTIYKITNKLNGHFYIGKHKTINLDDGYMGSGKLIKAAIRKHGKENFTKEILEIFDTEEEMNEAEKRYVVLGEGSYNLCPGGQGGWGYIDANGLRNPNAPKIAGESFKLKIQTDKIFAKKFSEMHRAIAIARGYKIPRYNWKGKKHSEETKIKMSLAQKDKQKGEKNSQYGTCWINKDGKNFKIKKEILIEYLDKGYIKGRIGKSSNG